MVRPFTGANPEVGYLRRKQGALGATPGRPIERGLRQWSDCYPWKVEAVGSNPASPIFGSA